MPLNLTHGDKVDALGPGLYERFGQLDIFIANAGILGTLSPLPHVKSDDWQRVMSLNVDANFRLMRTLDPLLRKSDAARVVLVSSSAAWKCKAYWGPYSVSKAAVDALMKTYANEVANTAIRVNSLDPGATRTAMRAKAMPGEDPQTVALPQSLDDVFIALASRECTHQRRGRRRPAASGLPQAADRARLRSSTKPVRPMNFAATDKGQQHLGIGDGVGVDREDVAIENDQVGALADRQRPGVVRSPGRRRGIQRIAADHFLDRQCAAPAGTPGGRGHDVVAGGSPPSA